LSASISASLRSAATALLRRACKTTGWPSLIARRKFSLS